MVEEDPTAAAVVGEPGSAAPVALDAVLVGFRRGVAAVAVADLGGEAPVSVRAVSGQASPVQ
jgi:hypothetical protein